jgi:hypothetical protein
MPSFADALKNKNRRRLSEMQYSVLPEPGRVTIDERYTQIHPCLLKIDLEPIAEAD